LVFTKDRGFTGGRQWKEVAAEFQQHEQQVTVSVTLPEETTAWFISITSDNLTATSDYQITEQP